MTRRRAATSEAMVCAEMSERPRPAITACLMVSFEPISMVNFGGWIICAFRKNSKILRVPEPSSRTMNFWLGQFGFGDALGAGEAVAGGGDHHVGVRAEGFAIGAEIAGRAAHDGHIYIVIAQGFDGFHAIADDELQVNSGVLAQESGDEFGGEIFRGGNCAEADASTVQAFHGFERVAEVGDDAINARGGGDGFTAGVGGAEAVAGAVEEGEAEVFFEKFDAGGERRGGDMQRLRGFDYGAAAGDLVDGFELFKGEVGHDRLSIFLSEAVIIFTFIVPGKLLGFGFFIRRPGYEQGWNDAGRKGGDGTRQGSLQVRRDGIQEDGLLGAGL